MIGNRCPLMWRLMRRLEQRCEANHGRHVDYAQSYWTPPMPPKLALDLESGQIEEVGLAPMVSITDHDSIQAPLLLQTVGERQSPISVEWSVPYGPQFFHLGVHNLPNATASEWMEILANYTARPVHGQLKEILSALHSDPRVLVIFNHPMWDLYRVGEKLHVELVGQFLLENQEFLHAIELNGLRNWEENRKALHLAEKWKMVLISGGDRHGLEPNANINLTNAGCFEEFVHEIRCERLSNILFMPQYAEPWKHRILQSAVDAVRHYPHFPRGSQRWDERVYHPDRNGVPKPLSALWPDGTAPRAMRWGIALVQMMGRGVVSGGLRAVWSETHDLQLALEKTEV